MRSTARFGFFVALCIFRLTKTQTILKDKYDALKRLDAQVMNETLQKAKDFRVKTESFSLELQRFVDVKRAEYFEFVSNGTKAAVLELEELVDAHVETQGTKKDCSEFVSRKLGALKLMLDAYFDDCVQLSMYDRVGLFYVRSDRMKLTTMGRKVYNASAVILDCMLSSNLEECIDKSVVFIRNGSYGGLGSFFNQREEDIRRTREDFLRLYGLCVPHMISMFDTNIAAVKKSASNCVNRINSVSESSADSQHKDLYENYKKRDLALSNTVVKNVADILERLKAHPRDMKNKVETERNHFIGIVNNTMMPAIIEIYENSEAVKKLQPERTFVVDECLKFFRKKISALLFVAKSSFDEYEKVYYYRTRTLYTIPSHRLYPMIAQKAYNASAVILDCASEPDMDSCIEAVLLENETTTVQNINAYVSSRLKRLAKLLDVFHEGMQYTIPSALRFFERSVADLAQKTLMCIERFDLVSDTA